MNSSKAENNAKTRKRYVLIPINEKLGKIIIDTTSYVSLIDKEYYNEIGAAEL